MCSKEVLLFVIAEENWSRNSRFLVGLGEGGDIRTQVLPSYLINLAFQKGNAKRLSDSTLSPPSSLHSSILPPSFNPKYPVLLTVYFSIHKYSASTTSRLRVPVCRYSSIRSTRSPHYTGAPRYLQTFFPRQYEAADNNAIWHWLATQCRRPQDPRVSR